MMKSLRKPAICLAFLASLAPIDAMADITLRVNIGDAVKYRNGIEPWQMLPEGETVIEGWPIDTELRVPMSEYSMKVFDETSGKDVEVSSMQDYFRAFLHPESVSDGDVVSITVTEMSEDSQVFYVIFDNPDAGYVAILTNYDISGGSCYGDDYPLDSNEDEYLFPDDEGVVTMPFDYNKRFRIRPWDGYSLVKAWNEMETNPHYEGYLANSRGVMEIYEGELGIGHIVRVTSVEHGEFNVKCVGNKVEDIRMSDIDTTFFVDLDGETTTLDVHGQTYMIRSDSSTISKVEVTQKNITTELEPYSGHSTFMYKPSNGDLLVITTDGTLTGVEDVTIRPVDETVYSLDGKEVSARPLPAGVYIIGGKKAVVR